MLTKFRRAVARALSALADRIDPDLSAWLNDHPADDLADLMALLDECGPTQDESGPMPAFLVRTGCVTRAVPLTAETTDPRPAFLDRLAEIDAADFRAAMDPGADPATRAADAERWAEAHLRAQVAALGG